MTRDIIKPIWYYAGLPILMITIFLVQVGRINPFIILWHELIIIFGYIAAVVDVKTRKIPNKLVIIMFIAWMLTITPKLLFDIDASTALLRDSVLGFVVSMGLFLTVYIVSRKGLGGGDVKFMAVSGLYLGLGGAISTILCGSILAAMTGLILIAFKKIGRRDQIPLAPFLYIGILVTILFQ